MRRWFYESDVLPWLLGYAWFLVVGKTLWWLDFAFLTYDGPSSYLYFCSIVGWFALLTLGVYPVSIQLYAESPWWKRTQVAGWRPINYLGALGTSAVLTFTFFFFGFLLFGCLSLPIGWVSMDVADEFLRYTTIMRD